MLAIALALLSMAMLAPCTADLVMLVSCLLFLVMFPLVVWLCNVLFAEALSVPFISTLATLFS